MGDRVGTTAGEQDYREIVSHLDVGIAVYAAVDDGADFVFLDLNRAGERICKIEREQVIGRRVTEAFPAVASFGLLAVLQHVWHTGQRETLPARNYVDDRLSLWAENHVLKLDSGEIVVLFTDVTTRVAAETALRQSEEKLKQAQSLAHLGYWDLDLATGCAQWSDEEFRLLGYAPGEVAPSAENFMRAVHPDDRAAVAAEMQRAMSPAETRPYRITHRVVGPTGERIVDERGQVSFSDDGRPLRMFGTTMDVTEQMVAKNQLQEAERRLKQAQAIAKIGSWHLDMKAASLTWTDETYRIFGLAVGSPVSYELFLDRVHPDDRDKVDRAWQAAVSGAPYDIVHRVVVDGEIKWVNEKAELVFDATGKLETALGTVQEITERFRTEEALALYANVFEHSGEAIVVTDSDNRIVAVNPAFTQLTGYTLDEVAGKDPSLLSSGRTPPEVYAEMWAALERDGYWQGELWDRSRHGTVYPKWAAISAIRDATGSVSHYVCSFNDITERKAAEKRIHFLAHHDALTGLANRHGFESRLEQALRTAQREQHQLALLFIDLDHFKTINDTLGHPVGDGLLQEAALRLRGCVRASDIVARLGGDEFVVVLTQIATPNDAAAIAEKIRSNLGAPYEVAGQILHCSASLGLGICPADGQDATTLMKNADTALYYAKGQGRNNFQFFTAAMNVTATERLNLESELRAALRRREFELHYQPKVVAISGRVCGVEALVRWRHPGRGLVPPLKFIPVAEESGMIEPLGAWVLEEACRQMAQWRRAGLDHVHMAVNLSARQLRLSGLVDDMRALLAEHALGNGDLELEITESVAMADPDAAIEQLSALRVLGVNLAIDDFGTGYSSLAYLKRLPIQTLKLDRAFVRDIETDHNDAAISTATLALAHSLGLQVVAEGVENDAQRDFLSRNGCDMLQGYLFGKPAPAEHWTADWLQRSER